MEISRKIFKRIYSNKEELRKLMRDVFHEKIDDFWYKDKELCWSSKVVVVDSFLKQKTNKQTNKIQGQATTSMWSWMEKMKSLGMGIK